MERTGRDISFKILALFSLAGLLGGVSCGGGSGGGACGAAQTCGGDLVGTWKATSSCLSARPEAFGVPECPTATGDLSKVTLSGTTTFHADLTEQSTTILGGTLTVTFPSACLAGDADCNATTARLTAAAADSLWSSASCRSGGGGCVCDFVLRSDPMDTVSTYAISGASLTETDSDGSVTRSTYCVSGTKLTQHIDASVNGGISGTITATKQ